MVRILIMMILIGRMVCALTIKPPIINEEFRDGVISEEIMIVNDTLEKKRYKIDVRLAEEYERWSLKEDIKVFPRVISLEPKKSKRVRVRVVKDNLFDGEYKGYLVVREMPINIDYGSESKKNLNIEIKMATEYWLSVYGMSGEIDRGIEIEDELIGEILNVKVKSIGNAGRSVWARINIGGDGVERVEELPICRIMRGMNKESSIKLNLKEGELVKNIVYFNPKEEAMKGGK